MRLAGNVQSVSLEWLRDVIVRRNHAVRVRLKLVELLIAKVVSAQQLVVIGRVCEL